MKVGSTVNARSLEYHSHLFREICLPMLFSSITHLIQIQNEPRWVSWEIWSATILLCSTKIKRLASSPKLAVLPRQWKVIASSDLDGLRINRAITKDDYKLLQVSHQIYLDSVSQNLSALTGLRTIEISFFDIGEDILNALKKLPALESLICLWTLSFNHSSLTTP